MYVCMYVGVFKSELNLVLILCIYEFDSYRSLFSATNNKRKVIYCDFNGKIFILLKSDDKNLYF
jgi:hypothetical protein